MALRTADTQSTRQLGTSLVSAPGALKQVEVLALSVSVDTQMSVTFDSGYVNEVQSVYTDATGGTFTLTYAGQTTAAIAFDAVAATVETDLEALSTITDVTVSGAGTLASPWIVTFVDPGGADLALMTSDGALLTGATLGVVIAEDTAGAATTQTVLYLPADGNKELPFGDEAWFVLPANKALTYTMSAAGNISVLLVYEEIDT